MNLVNPCRFAAASVSTSYANSGGTGNRTASITVTKSASAGIVGALSRFVGVGASGTYFSSVPDGEWLKFDFGSGVTKVITELTYSQSHAYVQGTWQLEGSNDNSTWTAVGSTFTLAAATSQTSGSAFSSNSTYYRYYRIKKTAGFVSAAPWAYQFDFKISA